MAERVYRRPDGPNWGTAMKVRPPTHLHYLLFYGDF